MGGTDTGPTVLDRLAVGLLDTCFFAPRTKGDPPTAGHQARKRRGRLGDGGTHYEMENSPR